MAKSPTSDVAAHLLAASFNRREQNTCAPLVDTPMQVNLEQLRPYQLNPRRALNPQHQAIKASIRQRGLDQPPNITRRPGEEHFIIRNGGNTRLAILNELWQETGDERFHRFLCLFRPWTARGEILALTGHLAENDLRSGLTYIERRQAVEQARQLYEQEYGKPLNQRELAERLSEDGYPVDQPTISRMGDTLTFLLPAIPEALYSGLGRPQIRKLLSLRKAAQRTWQRHVPDAEADFSALFQQSLARCDAETKQFSIPRVRDELLGDLAQQLTLDYGELALDIGESEIRREVLGQLLEPEVPLPLAERGPASGPLTAPPDHAKPSTAEQLRTRIAELARSLVDQPTEVRLQPEYLGFLCFCTNEHELPAPQKALIALLLSLTGQSPNTRLGPLLCGTAHSEPELDDPAFSRLIRLIKLARQLPHSGESQ